MNEATINRRLRMFIVVAGKGIPCIRLDIHSNSADKMSMGRKSTFHKLLDRNSQLRTHSYRSCVFETLGRDRRIISA